MAQITFMVANSQPIIEEGLINVIGKNGFQTILGSTSLLVTQKTTYNTLNDSKLSVSGLSLLHDDNFDTHVLDVNDLIEFSDIHPHDYVSVPVNEKIDDGILDGYVAYNPKTVEYSAKIDTYNLDNNLLYIKDINPDKLPTVPFFLRVPQLIDSRYFSPRSIFIEGTKKDIVRNYNIQDISGVFIADIGKSPVNKLFVDVFINEKKLPVASYDINSNNTVSVDLSTLDLSLYGNPVNLRTVSHYRTVPTIEVGDSISILSSNIYKISSTSYDPESINYNASLTASGIYKIYLEKNLMANVSGLTAVNISPDIIGGVVTSNTTNNVIIEYDENKIPGIWNLKNNFIYSLSISSGYSGVFLDNEKIIKNVPAGSVVVRARNSNSMGRKSPYTTKQIEIQPLRISPVTNLIITEGLYKDATQGVVSRVVIQFDHIQGQEVTDYEVSWKLTSSTDLNAFNTIKVPSIGIDDDGKIRVSVTNIEKFTSDGDINAIIVRVTPLNKSIRGITREETKIIEGKSAKPFAVVDFNVIQLINSLVFSWDFVRDDITGIPVDLDLNEIEIRSYPGEIGTSSIDIESAWQTGNRIITLATPSTRATLPISDYNTYTFMCKTRDTSKNECETAATKTITINRLPNYSIIANYNEDDPSVPVTPGVTNNNVGDYYFASYNNVDNGGIYSAFSNPTENANAVAIGFSTTSEPSDLDILSDYATYQTPFRDLGFITNGRILVQANLIQESTILLNQFYSPLINSFSDPTSNASLLKDDDFGGLGISIGEYLTSQTGITYSSEFDTLIKPLSSNSQVYGIIIQPQFINDTSNANVVVLLQSINANNTVNLGNIIYANGMLRGNTTWPNLTLASSSYKLVDLTGIDENSSTNFVGQNGIITSNIEIRYSTTNVFFQGSNANVDSSAITSGPNFTTYAGGDITFRWFQLRYNVYNRNPNIAKGTFDKFRYSVELPQKTFTRRVIVTTDPVQVDYSSQNYFATPVISLEPDISSNIRLGNTFVALLSADKYAANISVYSNTGEFVSDVTVNIIVSGA